MGTVFPGGLDNLSNPTPSNDQDDVGVLHSDQHANANDAIEALEAKVGINGSLVTTSLDYKTSAPGLMGTLGGAVAPGTGEVVVTAAPYNARCDAKLVGDMVSFGSAVVTSATAGFVLADVGKTVSLRVGATGVTTTVASYQSPTQVTLATTVPAGTGGIMAWGTNDTSANNAAAAAVPSGGTLVIPGRTLMTTPLVAPRSMTVKGTGVGEATGGVIDSTYGSGPSLAPYLTGSVILQVGAGQNGVNITGTGVNVHARDIGVQFGPAIMFNNTGHGWWAVPTATYLTGHENGLFNPRWDNLPVFGHDGNHYAHYILNSNLGTFTHLRGHGGGGLYLESDSAGAGFGNAHYDHPFYRVFCGGTANGFTLKCIDVPGSSPPQPSLNLIKFTRPQCNILGAPIPPAFSSMGITPPTVAQYTWRNVKTGTRWPSSIFLDCPDLENDGVNAYPNDFGGMHSGTVVVNGGFIAIPPAGGYSTPNRSSPGIPQDPIIVAGAGAGTGPDCRLLQGDDQCGVMLLQSGTSPGAALSIVATVTCPSMPPTGIKAVFIEGYSYSAGYVQWYIDDIADDSKSFTIRAWNGPLTASYPYQVVFQVVPRNTPNGTI